MDKEQTAKVLSYLRTSYTLNPGTNANAVLNVWYDFFKDIPYEIVFNATKEFMINDKNHNYNNFPGVGQIMAIIKDDQMEDIKVNTEAWAEVMEVVRDARYNPKMCFSKLPKLSQEALGSSKVLLDLANCTSEYSVKSIESRFYGNYERLKERHANKKALALTQGKALELEQRKGEKLLE